MKPTLRFRMTPDGPVRALRAEMPDELKGLTWGELEQRVKAGLVSPEALIWPRAAIAGCFDPPLPP